MFERFTERARNVVVLAQEEARHFNHNYIGTEHLLLGLLREDEGVAAVALSSVDVSLGEVREQVQSIVGYGEEGSGGQAPFTPRSKKVLELSLREALQLGHNYIGTEHILLGLIHESEGVAARALSNLSVDPDEISRGVAELLGGSRVGKGRKYGRLNEPYLARVTGIEVEARFGLSEEERTSPRRLQVDLEYAHDELDSESLGRDLYRAAEEAVLSLEQRPFEGLADGVERIGLSLLTNVPEARRVEVTVSVLQTPSGRGAPETSLTGTFHQ